MHLQQITNRVRHIRPLLDTHNPVFEEHYKRGLFWYLFEQHELARPLSDEDLFVTIHTMARTVLFDGQHEHNVYERIGTSIGILHAAVLSLDGTVRPDSTSLITFTRLETQSAYSIARESWFLDPVRVLPPLTDEELLTTIRDLVLGEDWDRTGIRHLLAEEECYHCIGDFAGTLSAHLFPWTAEDAQAARAHMQDFEARLGYFLDAHTPNTGFYDLLHYGVTEAIAV